MDRFDAGGFLDALERRGIDVADGHMKITAAVEEGGDGGADFSGAE
jgi:hypothetical protein